MLRIVQFSLHCVLIEHAAHESPDCAAIFDFVITDTVLLLMNTVTTPSNVDLKLMKWTIYEMMKKLWLFLLLSSRIHGGPSQPSLNPTQSAYSSIGGIRLGQYLRSAPDDYTLYGPPLQGSCQLSFFPLLWQTLIFLSIAIFTFLFLTLLWTFLYSYRLIRMILALDFRHPWSSFFHP